MDGFIKMMLGGGDNAVKTPLVILSQETDLLFLEKRINAISDAHDKAHEEVCDKYRAQHLDAWGKLTDHLLEKGLIKHKDEKLEFKDGVLYKVEVNENEH